MVIITGASKGVGKYLFDKMSACFDVVGTYCSTECKNLSNMHKVDVSDYDSVQSFCRTLGNKIKDIVLINCAGITYTAYTHKSDPKLWKNVVEVNLIGSYNMIRTFLPKMREQNYGRIINFSSVVTVYPTPGVSAYAASKSALIGLTKTLAIENGSKGISANVINLGYVNIGMGENDVTQEYKNKLFDQIPMKRFGYPEEIYNTVEYLINTEYVNGSIIDINGGLI